MDGVLVLANANMDLNIRRREALPPELHASLIATCLRKLESDGTLDLIVVPLWPTHAWWPQLLNLLIATPVILPQQNDLLTLTDFSLPKD